MTQNKDNKNSSVQKGFKKAGTYKIVNEFHKTTYIGKSLDLDQREKTHKRSLISGTSEIQKLQEHYNEIESKGKNPFDYIKYQEIEATTYNLNTTDTAFLESKYADLEKKYLSLIADSGQNVYNVWMLTSQQDDWDGILLKPLDPFMISSTTVEQNIKLVGRPDESKKKTVYTTDEETTFILWNSISINSSKPCKIGKIVYTSVNRAAEEEGIADVTVIDRISQSSPWWKDWVYLKIKETSFTLISTPLKDLFLQNDLNSIFASQTSSRSTPCVISGLLFTTISEAVKFFKLNKNWVKWWISDPKIQGFIALDWTKKIDQSIPFSKEQQDFQRKTSKFYVDTIENRPCQVDGKIYSSILEACNDLNLNLVTFVLRLNSNSPEFKNYKFVF